MATGTAMQGQLLHSQVGCRAPFRVARPSRRSAQKSRIVSQASSSRRDVLVSTGTALLLAGAPLVSAPPAGSEELEKRTMKVQYLSAIQKNAQRAAFKARAEKELRDVLTADDAPAALRLVLHDAATYDADTGTGGVNGSIVLTEELNRPENADLKDIVKKLQAAKAAIDGTSASASIPTRPITWPDLAVLGAKVAAERSWFAAKKARLGAGADVDTISSAFGADFPVFLGRKEATAPDVPAQFPDPSNPLEVRDFMKKLGTRSDAATGFFAAKPLFWERPTFVIWTAAQPDPANAEADFAAADPVFADLKDKYDKSRRTVTRTDYEVDFISFFQRLCKLGATVDQDLYVTDVLVDVPKL